MSRDWRPALVKVRDEGECRACGSTGALDPAHIIPRSRAGDMSPENIVPLCRGCHQKYDAGCLELLPVLSIAEQVHAVALVGIEEARQRTVNRLAA